MKMNLKSICAGTMKMIAFAVVVFFTAQTASAQATLADFKLDVSRLEGKDNVISKFVTTMDPVTGLNLMAEIKEKYSLNPTTANLNRLKFYSQVIEAVMNGMDVQAAVESNFVFVNPNSGVTTPNALTAISKGEQQVLADEVLSTGKYGFYK